MSAPPTLILASASPRRRELLTALNVPFMVQPAPLAEPTDRPPNVTPRAWAMALAHFKAASVADTTTDAWVLGADTVVACAGELLGKPDDRADAERMLALQAGAVSDVVTGLALVPAGRRGPRSIVAGVTRVWMRDNPDLRNEYLAGGDWAGKAGAYGIQDIGERLVERIAGSFSNVVGLPIELTGRLLASAGFRLSSPPPELERRFANRG